LILPEFGGLSSHEFGGVQRLGRGGGIVNSPISQDYIMF